MALSKKPVTGMKDILPEEMVIRDYVIGVIKETYGKFGFTSIETPCVENIENLADSLSAAQDETKAVLSDVMRLPERFRVPIVLYYYLGFSTSEIAELLHVPAATARTRLARGRSKLKFILEEGDREIQSNQAGLRVHPSR